MTRLLIALTVAVSFACGIAVCKDGGAGTAPPPTAPTRTVSQRSFSASSSADVPFIPCDRSARYRDPGQPPQACCADDAGDSRFDIIAVHDGMTAKDGIDAANAVEPGERLRRYERLCRAG